MSHGGPHPSSGASYVIICNGRIGILLSKSIEENILTISGCATDLCSYLGTRYRGALDHADLTPLQTAQHFLMDQLEAKKVNQAECEERIGAMFEMMEILEEKYDMGGGY